MGMKYVGILLASILVIASAFAADGAKEDEGPVHRASKPTETGMELFSWHVKGEEAWHFALLPAPGNEKLKSVEVVTAKENALDGPDALKKKLAALALNEKVGWYNMLEKKDAQPGDVIFDFPPREIIKDLEIYCTVMKIRLNIFQTGAKKRTE
jgi:hypothetical protein